MKNVNIILACILAITILSLHYTLISKSIYIDIPNNPQVVGTYNKQDMNTIRFHLIIIYTLIAALIFKLSI